MLMLLVFIVLLTIGTPIFSAMVLSSMAYVLQSGNFSLFTMAAQRMFASVNSFTLLAVPFFVFAGMVMNMSGISKRLFDFANTLVGHLTGGLGHVNILASMIFAGMSGSAVADAAGLGAIEMRAMHDAGFDDEFSGAVTAASSTIGPVIPPSIPMVLFSGLTSVSAGRLFLGGSVPGILMGITLMATVYCIAKKRHYPVSHQATAKQIGKAFLEALPALLMPAIILGGILSGFFTPTEAAAVACLYAVLLGVFLYRELTPANLARELRGAMRNTAQVMAIIAAAGFFGWLVTFQGIPAALIELVCSFTESRWVVLLLINLVCLVLGCFMEGNAILILAVPIMIPIAQKFTINPVHLGVIMCLNIMIGTITPPVGVCLYPVCTLGKIMLQDLIKELVPFLAMLVATLLLITYVEPLVMFLPNALLG